MSERLKMVMKTIGVIPLCVGLIALQGCSEEQKEKWRDAKKEAKEAASAVGEAVKEGAKDAQQSVKSAVENARPTDPDTMSKKEG